MKYCIFCGSQMEDEDIFCSYCGRQDDNIKAMSEEPQAGEFNLTEDEVEDIDLAKTRAMSPVRPPAQPVPQERRVTVIQPDLNEHEEYYDEDDGRSKRSKIIIAILIAAIVLLLGIAAGAGYYLYSHRTIEVESIDGGVESIELVMGESLETDYKVLPEDATDQTITYAIADEEIASVDENGIVTGIKPGETVLTVTASELSEEVPVTIKACVTKIEGVKDVTLYKATVYQLKPKLKPSEYADLEITYTSSDEDVLSVDKKGKATCHKTGQVEVTLAAGGYEKTIIITIINKPPEPETDTATDEN